MGLSARICGTDNNQANNVVTMRVTTCNYYK